MHIIALALSSSIFAVAAVKVAGVGEKFRDHQMSFIIWCIILLFNSFIVSYTIDHLLKGG
jgi:hypothetical protein